MIEQIPVADLRYMLGFFMALALRRGRIDSLVGGFLKFFPNSDNPGFGSSTSGKGDTDTAPEK